MPAFDTIRIWNPSPNQRVRLQEFTIPCARGEAVTLADRFYAINPLNDGRNIECSVERSAHMDPNIGTRFYRNLNNTNWPGLSGLCSRLRLAVPVVIPAGPGYRELEIWRGTAERPAYTPAAHVLSGLRQARIVFRPFGDGEADLVVFDGAQAVAPDGTIGGPTLRRIKRPGLHCIRYEFFARAAQPRQSGGHPWQARLIMEVASDLDEVRCWIQHRCFDGRDPTWRWEQGAQSNPAIRWLVEGAGQHFPWARVIGRYEAHSSFQDTFEAGGRWYHFLVIEPQYVTSKGPVNRWYRHGNQQMREMVLWFAPSAGASATGNQLRDSTRDTLICAQFNGTSWIRLGEGSDIARETAAISTNEWRKQEAQLGGYLPGRSTPEWGATTDAVRNAFRAQCENASTRGRLNRRWWELLAGGYGAGPYWSIANGLTNGSSSAVLGQLIAPCDNGAPSLHENVGWHKLWLEKELGEPVSFESYRITLFASAWPVFWTDLEGMPVQAKDRPRLLAWSGTARNTITTYDDVLGKSGEETNYGGQSWLLFSPKNGGEPGLSAPGWAGPENAHWEDPSLEYSVVSGNVGAIDITTELAHHWCFHYPITGGRAGIIGSQTRGVGRFGGNMAAYYYATGIEHIWRSMIQQAANIEAHYLDMDTKFPGRVHRNIIIDNQRNSDGSANVNSGPNGCEERDPLGHHWRTTEEGVAGAGIFLAWRETGDQRLRVAIKDMVEASIKFGHELHCTATAVVWAASRRGANAIRVMPDGLGTRKLTQAEFAIIGSTGSRGGPLSLTNPIRPLYYATGDQALYVYAHFCLAHMPEFDFHTDLVMRKYLLELDPFQYTVRSLPRIQDLPEQSLACANRAAFYRMGDPKYHYRANAFVNLSPPMHGQNAPKTFAYEGFPLHTNYLRRATRFALYSIGGARVSTTVPNLRSDGYPAQLAGGQEVRCTFCEGATAETGLHRIRWDGEGTLILNNNGTTINLPVGTCPPGGVDFTVTGLALMGLTIRATNVGNPVRNVRVYRADREAALHENEGGAVGSRGFHPEFLRICRDERLNALRFLDWMYPWSDVVSTESHIPPDEYYTLNAIYDGNGENQLQRQQCAIGAIIDTAWALGLNYVWITIPSRTWSDTRQTGGVATEGWLQHVADRLNNELPPYCRVVWENSNENWNGGNGAFVLNRDYFLTAGNTGGPRGEAPRIGQSEYDRMGQALALRHSQIASFIRRHPINARSIITIMWQAATDHSYWHPNLTRMLSAPDGTPLNPPVVVDYDAYGCSFYWGNDIWTDVPLANLRSWTPAQYHAYNRADMDNRVFGPATSASTVTRAAAVAAADGKIFLAYEGGMHDQVFDETARIARRAATLDPGQRALTAYAFQRLAALPNWSGGCLYHQGVRGDFGEIQDDWRNGLENEQTYLAMVDEGVRLFGSTNRPPTIQQLGSFNVIELQVMSPIQVVASDPDGDSVRFAMSGQPAGVVIDPVTGRITGTPGAGTARTAAYPCAVTATDPAGLFATMTFPLFVNEGTGSGNTPPTIWPPNAASFLVGVAITPVQVVASDPDVGDVLTYFAYNLPPGLSINASTGLITGTPSSTGTFLVNLSVADLAGDSADTEWTAQVRPATPVNLPPVFAAIPNQTATANLPFSLTMSATDPEGSPVTFSARGLPNWLVLVGNQLLGIPRAGNVTPPITITVQAIDSLGAVSTRSFTLTVRAAFEVDEVAPVVEAQPNETVSVASTFARVLRATDANSLAGDTMVWSATGLPPWAVIKSTGQLTGRIEGIVPDDAGGTVWEITVRATDRANLFDEKSFTLTVAQPNRAPSLTQPLDQELTENLLFGMTLVGSDPDVGDTLTYSATGLPPGLSVVGANIQGTPPVGAAQGSPYRVTARVTDRAGEFAERSFIMRVEPEDPGNVPPELTDPGQKSGQVGVAITPFTLVATDPDVGDTIRYSMTGAPQGLTVNDTTGQVSGTPFARTDRLSPYLVTYRATDQAGAFDEVRNFITIAAGVGGEPTNPPAWDLTTLPANQLSNEGDVVSGLDVNATDPESQPITYSATGLPPGVTIHAFTGVISGTIAEGASLLSPFRVVLRAQDTDRLFAEHAFVWEVRLPMLPRPPVIRDPGAQLGYEQRPFFLLLRVESSGNNLPSVRWSATGLPRRLALTSQGEIEGTIAPGTIGASPYRIRVTATNTDGLSSTLEFTLSVRPRDFGGGTGRKRRFLGRTRRDRRRRQ